MPESGNTTSVWMLGQELVRTAELREDLQTEICVIGAGLAGLTSAYLLGRAGRRVVVIEARVIGGGETSRTTAHLSSVIDDRFTSLERVRGRDAARLAADSHGHAVDLIERIVREERIDCRFQRVEGYLFREAGHPYDLLDEEQQAASRAGVRTEPIHRAPFPDFDTGPCLRFPYQAQFHPLRYLHGLREAVIRQGGRIFTGTRAQEVEGGPPPRVSTREGPTVTAEAVIVATNSPVSDRWRMHSKLFPYRTYAVALRMEPGRLPPGLYWDTADPYHYLRTQPFFSAASGVEEELLIVGGEDHKTGHEGADQAAERYSRLERWARERVPEAGEVEARWSGQVLETLDGLAYIGRDPSEKGNVFIATGDSGMGMTHGTIAGLLLRDLVLGTENPWTGVYEPSRTPVGAARDFLAENLDVARQYLDWISPGAVRSPEQIPPRSGAVLRRGTTLVAVYRDEQGALHELSAKCTHLQCVVQWNAAEGTWDCPCHGSRFSALGEVLSGPATQPLQPVKGR